jgi:hypothetical protein
MTTQTLERPAAAKTPVEQQLYTAQDLFIRRWGEMGQTWGINRTMAEIHALLYITARPLCTDDVMERLNISRGQRVDEPAGAVRLGHRPAGCTSAASAAGVLREPRRRVGDVLADVPPSANAVRWTRSWRRSASASSMLGRGEPRQGRRQAVRTCRRRACAWASMEEFMR